MAQKDAVFSPFLGVPKQIHCYSSKKKPVTRPFQIQLKRLIHGKIIGFAIDYHRCRLVTIL